MVLVQGLAYWFRIFIGKLIPAGYQLRHPVALDSRGQISRILSNKLESKGSSHYYTKKCIDPSNAFFNLLTDELYNQGSIITFKDFSFAGLPNTS